MLAVWSVGASEVGSSLRLAVGSEALLDSLGGLLGCGGAGCSLLPISPLLGKAGQLRNPGVTRPGEGEEMPGLWSCEEGGGAELFF